MKYETCFRILEGLNAIKSPGFSEIKDLENKNAYIPSAKFMYAVAKNKSALEKIIADLRKTIEPAPDFKEYQEKREELNRRYSKKDENDQPMKELFYLGDQPAERYIIPGIDSEKSEYSKAFKQLKADYKDAIDAYDAKIASYGKMLQESADKDFKPFFIDMEEIPLGLSSLAWDGLYYIIKEDVKSETPSKKT